MVFVAFLGDLEVDIVDCSGDGTGDRRYPWIPSDDHRRTDQPNRHRFDHRRAADPDWDHARDTRAVLIQQTASRITTNCLVVSYPRPL